MGLNNPDPVNEEERQPTIKITDFTTALIVPHDANDPSKESQYKVSSQDGSLAFNAPEQLLEHEFLPKPLDIWAYGITIFLYWNDNLPLAYQNQEMSRQEFEDVVK